MATNNGGGISTGGQNYGKLAVVIFLCIFVVSKGGVLCPRVITTRWGGGDFYRGAKLREGKERHGEEAPSQRAARQTCRGVEPRLTKSIKIGKHRN